MTIIPWKNDGKEGNEKLKLFRISWNMAAAKWVRNTRGKYWGFYAPESKEIVRHEEEPERSSANVDVGLVMGTPSLGVVEKGDDDGGT